MASTYLSRTQTNGNRRKFTFSAWVKRSEISNGDHVICSFTTSGNNIEIKFKGDDIFNFYNYYNGSSNVSFRTNRKFRDISAWYHIVVAVDTEQSSPANRIKIYFNGVQETSFSTEVIPSQNLDLDINTSGKTNSIGAFPTGHSYFNGCLSHIHFIDGTQYAASDFGSTDSTTGEWKINTSPSVTYGTNGFFILKDDNAVTDRSGEGNNFALTAGTLTKTEDCPSNVFNTWNVLDSHYFWGAAESSWCTNGNTKARSGNSQYSSCSATLGASSGKYYWEIKASAASNSEKYYQIGIKSKQDVNTSTGLGYNSGYYDYAYRGHDGSYVTNGAVTTYGDTYQVGDIVGVAMDLDNNKLYFSKNGTWQNSGVPTSGSTGTGAISITDPDSTPFGFYLPAWSWQDGSSYGTIEANFGNGKFGTTAVSSAGTNASGNGIFEYDTPTGYTALSTKGLNL